MLKETEKTPSTPNTLPRTDEEDFTYELLTGHPRTDGSYKSDQELRMQYIHLTDDLIHKMTDGVTVKNPETGENETRTPDTVIFLDKSARPVAWLTRELWTRMAADPETGEIPPMPDFKFLNIDREQWVTTVDPDGNGVMNVSEVSPSVIRSLRSIFISPDHKQDGLTDAIDTAPSSLDGKTIMVVDEVQASGRTLDIAKKLVGRAFPDAYIGGAYWMSGITRRGTAVGNADLPVWYKSDDVFGRGVGDRDANESDNVTQRLGRWFLSTRFSEPDEKSLRLREEFHELATHPDVPLRPSNNRSDVIERLESLNGQPAEQVLNDISHVLGKPLGRR